MAVDTADIKNIVIEYVSPQSLHPHPRNAKIYGDESIDELKERILVSKWIKPLVVTSRGTIISGHRRWKCACELGLLSVPVERRDFASETDELEALLLENQFRDKTPEQKVREGVEWKGIEEEKSGQRQRSFLKQGTSMPVSENFHTRDVGRTTDKVAERVGFGSGRTYEKASTVVEVADQLKEQGRVNEGQTLLDVLNYRSVDAAAKITKLSEPQQEAVLQSIAAGQVKTVREAIELATPALVADSADEDVEEIEEDNYEYCYDPAQFEAYCKYCYNTHHRWQLFDDVAPGEHVWECQICEHRTKDEHMQVSVKFSSEEEITVISEQVDDAKERRDAHVMRVMGSSDSPEWYTPQLVIDLVSEMFGTIDTDPCSNSHETPTVPARVLYTKDDDGLSYIWYGKTYLNPPYGSEIGKWTNKLIDEYTRGNVEEGLALLPARIDTVWFQPLYDYLMCNVRGRIQFANSPYSAPFPCVIAYIGKREDVFIETFKKLGPIMRRVG